MRFRLSSNVILVCLLSLLAVVAFAGCRTVPPPPASIDLTTSQPSQPEPTNNVDQGIPIPSEILDPKVESWTLPEPEKTPSPSPQVPTSLPTAKPAATKGPLPISPNYRWTHVTTDGPYIALTFDDGPNPKNTRVVLDILKQRQIPATFFVLGQNAAAHPAVLERMVAEGHELGAHGWNHASFMGLTPEERAEQVRKTNGAIERALGRRPELLRPPFGATTPEMNRWLTEDLKMTVVLWSVDSRDWESKDPARIRRTILDTTKPGSVILMHDIYQATALALPETLDALLAKGYKFVTVSDLLSRQISR